MTLRRRTAALVLSASVLALPLASVATSPAEAATYHYKNCTALNKKFKHGVGRNGAHDKTSGAPVTNFKHSTSIYKQVIAYRKGLDRDKDGIACEKH